MTDAPSMIFASTGDHGADAGFSGPAPSPHCPVCDGIARSVPRFNLSACPCCGHVFQTDMRITAVYDAAYAHAYDTRPVAQLSALRWDFIQAHLDLPRDSRILDIGYGNGGFLKHAARVGMQIHGIDIHTEDFGIPAARFDDPVEYDLVSFFDSLEHFADFAPIFRLKARNVIVSLPQTPATILQDPTAWRHYKPGEHVHYFSVHSLDRLMRNWGFPVKRADGNPEDSIRGTVAIGQKRLPNIYTAIYAKQV